MIFEYRDGAGYLYLLTFASGKSYIGITCQDPRMRFWQHASKVRRGGGGVLCSAWRKHGDPEMQVLAVVEKTDLADLEVRAIRVFETQHPNGYNMTSGGERTTHNEETRRKLSDSHSGKRRAPLTAQHKANLSAAKTGKPKRQPPPSAETCRKISSALTGKVIPQSVRDKIAASLRGRPPASPKGVPFSEAHRAALREAWVRRRAR